MSRLLSVFMTLAVIIAVMYMIPAAARATVFEVEIEDFAFIPAGMHIQVGDAIEWRNRDSVPHTSTSDAGVWDSGALSRDQTFTFTFSQGGAFPYHCSIHPSMRDTIFVSSPTGIDDNLPETPTGFELSQNYPNPFNAQTAIGYALPNPAHVSIVVYDILGRTQSVLVDQDQAAGYHQVVWDATDAPTGVYFYRIEAEGYSQTRKMVLAK